MVRAITRLDELCREVRMLALALFALLYSHCTRQIPTIDDDQRNTECTLVLILHMGCFGVYYRALVDAVPYM